MNNDRLTESIVKLVEAIGWQVNSVHHPSSLRLELVVVPPLTATFADLQRMLAQLYDAPFWGSTIGQCFSSDHDCGRSSLRFRQEAPLPDFPEDQPYYNAMRAAEGRFCKAS